MVHHNGIGEIVAPHYEIAINNKPIVFIYVPLACHSYNEIMYNGNKMKVATIDTMLSFYLAFLYADNKQYDKDTILYMATSLFYIQQKNRLKQSGILKRFSINCIGKQLTLEDMRKLKTDMYNKLKNKRYLREYEMWFLRYIPGRNTRDNNSIKQRNPIKTKRVKKYKGILTVKKKRKPYGIVYGSIEL